MLVAVSDEYQQTAEPGIYAIGDLIHGPMLAHKAEDDGIAFAESSEPPSASPFKISGEPLSIRIL